MVLAMAILVHLLYLTFILGVFAPSSVLASQPHDSVLQCTHVATFEGVKQVREIIVAGPNAVANARTIWIDALGEPTTERPIPNGVALAWLESNSTSILRHVDLQMIGGALHITCGLSF
jgi:hypothetical protein